MPNYKRPGVFIEESLTPLTNTIGAPGVVAAAFVGANPQGPTVPTLVTTWSQYQALYGDFADGSYLLPFAVYQYFNNGGSAAWVVRAAASDAAAATATLKDREGSPVNLLTLTASSVGAWGNKLYIDVTDSGITGNGRFNLVLRLNGTADANIVERWVDVSMDPGDSRYLVNLINAPVKNGGSKYLKATNLKTGAGYVFATSDTPATQNGTPLTGGVDGTAALDLVAATEQLDAVDDLLTVNLPGVNDTTVLNQLINWAETEGTRFLVVDVPQAVAGNTPSDTATAYEALSTGGSALTASSYVAVYGPWLLVADPASAVRGATRSLPPGGAVLGRYAVTDVTRGVQKPPAGITARVTDVLNVETRFSSTDLDGLNQAGINIIRPVPGNGFCIMGARTLQTGMPSRYVSIRRTLQYLRKALTDGTIFAAFEPDNTVLWDQISASITQFLTSQMQIGLLSGNTPDQAFYVICDDSINTEQSVANGEVHIEVGVALNSPAEFIVITLGQYQSTASSSASDNA